MKKNIIVLFFLGFTCGLPYMLIFTTLSAWLRDVGISLTIIGFVSWAALMYSLKFLWSPIIENVDIPGLSKLGKRKSWIIFSQFMCLIGIASISFFDPQTNLSIIALLAFYIAFFGSIQDISVDAYRIELTGLQNQGDLAASYQFGYRVSILFATSLALIFAENFSWNLIYFLLSSLMLLGIFSTIFGNNPTTVTNRKKYFKTLLESFMDLLNRYGLISSAVILFIIASYRLTDIIVGPMAMPFYLDMGYSKIEIGSLVKTVALIMSVVGFFFGGFIIKIFEMRHSLILGGLLVLITNILFSITAISGKNIFLLATIVGLDSFAAGLVATVNITFLTSLVSREFTAVQYALLTSMMMLPGKLLGGFSGFMADFFIQFSDLKLGWCIFFIFTSALALPAMFTIYKSNKTFNKI